jgi:hypothetical protein
MSTHSAHKHWWQTFEAVFGIPFLAAIVLQVFLPLSFPRGFLTPVFIFTGAVFITVGAILVVLARQALAQRGQPTDPGFPTNELVTTGVFSISRNPLYLGYLFPGGDCVGSQSPLGAGASRASDCRLSHHPGSAGRAVSRRQVRREIPRVFRLRPSLVGPRAALDVSAELFGVYY